MDHGPDDTATSLVEDIEAGVSSGPVPHRLTIDEGDVVVVRTGCGEGELGYTRRISHDPVTCSWN